MILFIEYFASPDQARAKEYAACLAHNLACTTIRKIVAFVSDDRSDPGMASPKLEVVRLEERPTFKSIFEYANRRFEGEICIVANGDILFDDTLEHLRSIDMDNVFVALNKWEVAQGGDQLAASYSDFWFCQDAWIFKSPVLVSVAADFRLGEPGCDNKIAYLQHRLGMSIRNPSLKVVARHLHVSRYRSNPLHAPIPPPYLAIAGNDDVATPAVIEVCADKEELERSRPWRHVLSIHAKEVCPCGSQRPFVECHGGP